MIKNKKEFEESKTIRFIYLFLILIGWIGLSIVSKNEGFAIAGAVLLSGLLALNSGFDWGVEERLE
jgi:uncharacterized membrane protein (DUF441 family)